MKYTSLIVGLIASSQAIKISDVKLPEYRSEFYGNTWRYVDHPRIASEEDWVADAPAGYTVLQLEAQRKHHHLSQHKKHHKKHHGHGKRGDQSGIEDMNYDDHHDKQEEQIVKRYRKQNKNRLDNIDRTAGEKHGVHVYPAE